jgi:hypothetical protein
MTVTDISYDFYRTIDKENINTPMVAFSEDQMKCSREWIKSVFNGKDPTGYVDVALGDGNDSTSLKRGFMQLITQLSTSFLCNGMYSAGNRAYFRKTINFANKSSISQNYINAFFKLLLNSAISSEVRLGEGFQADLFALQVSRLPDVYSKAFSPPALGRVK